MTQALPKVARWAPMVRDELIRADLDPAKYGPALLGHIHSESGGDPSSYLKANGGYGLGGFFQWTGPGKRYKGIKTGPYWVHPDAYLGTPSRPLSWDPAVQLRAMVSLWAFNLRKAGGHQPSASHAYASGAGNVVKIMNGADPASIGASVARQHKTYIPTLYLQKAPAYHSWWQRWEQSGSPTATTTMQVGRGAEVESFGVLLADLGEVPSAGGTVAYEQPMDGTLRWGGRVATPSGWSRYRSAQWSGGVSDAGGATPSGWTGGRGPRWLLLALAVLVAGLVARRARA